MSVSSRRRPAPAAAALAAATALLLAAGLGAAPAQARPTAVTALSGDASFSITVATPVDRALEVGEVAEISVDVDTPEPSTLRLQEQPTGATSWADLDTAPVEAGSSSFDFLVPTEAPGTVTLRVALDETESLPAYTSDPTTFTVTEPTAPDPDPAPQPGGRPSTVTLSWPGAAQTWAGRGVTVTGKVSGGPGRTVRVELGTAHGWLPMGSGRSDAHGRFRIHVPTDWYYRGRLRASTDATTGRAAAASAGVPVHVRPSYSPRGRAADWTSLMGSGDHWDPCRRIGYKVNTTGAPKGGLAQVRKAFRLVHQATGLRFAYAGPTTAVPYRTDGKGKDVSDARFTVGWGTERQAAPLRGGVVGYGGYTSSGSEIVQGTVVLDRGARLEPGFGNGATWGALLLHEIGHAVGLGHAPSAEQIMYPMLQRSYRGRYEAGDLAGLRQHGAMGGCFGPRPTYGRVVAPHVVASE